MTTDHDVIVVGARVAGSSTAMLLARRGLRVLLVDQVSFPSDTISSHQVQVPGIALLRRWGLLDQLRAARTPATRNVRFDPGHVVMHCRFPAHDGVDELFSPRRTVLDSLLFNAARGAGAQVREHFKVEELIWSDGRVAGVRGRHRGGPQLSERARLVVGADGKNSLVARAVGATGYRQRPVSAFACYSYWSGLPTWGGELYQRPRRAVAVFPTNDDLVMVYTAAPIGEFDSFRRDVPENYLATLDACGDLGERVRSAVRAERIRATPDQPNSFRVAHGPGWALVGDAGIVLDSISAQGITNALRDAQQLSDAIVAGLGGALPLSVALARRQRDRDAAAGPMYNFTTKLARFTPPTRGQRHLLAAVADKPDEADRFLGALSGITPVNQYFTARNAIRVLGPAGLARLAITTAIHPASAPSHEKGV